MPVYIEPNMEPGTFGGVVSRSNLGLKFPREIFREVIVKKTIIALSLAAFAMSFVVPAYAANVACKPAKKGYHMVDGKCVAIKKTKK
jgi:hypothetical protein